MEQQQKYPDHPVDPRLWRAKALREEGQYEAAFSIILETLDDDPDNPQALHQATGLLIQQGKRGIAHNMAARCLKFAPGAPEAVGELRPHAVG